MGKLKNTRKIKPPKGGTMGQAGRKTKMIHAVIAFILVCLVYKLPLWSIVVFLVGTAVSRGAARTFKELMGE